MSMSTGGRQRFGSEKLQMARAVKAQLHPVGIEIRIKEMDDDPAPALARAHVDLVETGYESPLPGHETFLAAMLGHDVPSAWLPARVRSKVERVARLYGLDRTKAATRLAQAFARPDVHVAAFGDRAGLISQLSA